MSVSFRHAYPRRIAAAVAALLCLGALAAPAAGAPIRLTYATFDPLADGEPAVPPALRAAPGSPYALLQLSGPAEAGWIEDLKAAGVVFYDYLPTHTFVVKLPPGGADLVAGYGPVRWVGPLHPAYKISPHARGGEVVLALFPDAPAGAVALAAEALGARVLEAGAAEKLTGASLRGSLLVVHAGADLLPSLAALDGVRWVQGRPVYRLHNDDARPVVQSGGGSLLPLLDRGLTGAGQVGGVSDSGVDVYDFVGGGSNAANSSCYFRDDGGDGTSTNQTPPGPAHRKIVAYTVPPGAGGDFDDANGHGTHVVGSVAGDRPPWNTLSSDDGQAFDARIFFQDLNDDGSNFVFAPSDTRVMFQEAYDFNGDGVYQPGLEPRTHSNSWGGVDPTYDAGSFQVDDFMWTHPDFLILYSAGNQGPAPDTVGSPATAKSLVTVGATANGDGNPDDMADFSSHGPVPVAGRLKPTVSAPGVGLESAVFDDPCNVQSLSGTSMSNPTTHGVALLMRQYLWDGYYPGGEPDAADRVHPSGALLKALLMNSGRPMTGLFTDNGAGGTWPSNGQGWGRIVGDDALYFQGDHRALALTDVYALDGSAGFGAAGQSQSFQFEVRDGAPFAGEPLEVTLVWTDYPGTQLSNGALVNDLDLVVTGPGGSVHLGNDPGSNDFSNVTDLPLVPPDTVNPWEVVYLENPQPGTYTVEVRASNLPSLALDPVRKQGFALVATGDLVGSRGRAEIEHPLYDASVPVAVRLRVTDLDLDADPTAADSVGVTVTSTTDPAGVSVTLTETAPSSGIFTGAVPLTAGAAAAGELTVADGDEVRLNYQDADDGSGSPYTAFDTARVQQPFTNLVNPPQLADPGEVSDDGAYTLTWTAAEDTTGLTGYQVQQAVDYVEPLFDDAEGTLEENWTTDNNPPLNPPWTQNPAYSNSPALSFWSSGNEGVDFLDIDTSLTLNRDVVLPATLAEARLTFWSRYFNDPDDTGNVEVSTDGGATWQSLLVLSAAPTAPPADTRMQHHQVDLTDFIGTPLRLRFRFNSGPGNFIAFVTAGWWLDDVTLSGASWETVAVTGPGETSFEVTGQPNGRFFHRVRGTYAASGSATAWSNVEDILVDRPVFTQGIDDDDPAIEYFGGWHRKSDPAASNGGYHRRKGPNKVKAGSVPTARLVFEGDGITYLYATSSEGGTAEVFIDGASRGTVSYAGATSDPAFGSSVTYDGLGEGSHEIRIEYRSGTAYIDGFEVTSSAGAAGTDASAVAYLSITSTSHETLSGLPGALVVETVAVSQADEQVSVVVEGSGHPLVVHLLDPAGNLLATGGSLLGGGDPASGLDAEVTAAGVHTVQVVDLQGGAGGVEISIARTVRVE